MTAHHLGTIITTMCLFGVGPLARAETEARQPDQILVYQTVGDLDLHLHLFQPRVEGRAGPRPAYLTIHGGGWAHGDVKFNHPYAELAAEEGYVAFSVEYRRIPRPSDAEPNGVTVRDCVKDARAAVRYVRAHAKELHIDPDRIVVSGASAGGHLALGTALFDGVDHADEDLSVSCRPNVMVLYNPVVDTSEAGFGQDRIGETWRSLSPLHHVRADLPPTLIFHGDADRLVPFAGAKLFTEKMIEHGNLCELIVGEGGVHGYANPQRAPQVFRALMKQSFPFMAKHLVSSGKSGR